MKKTTFFLAIIATLLFNNSFAQVTKKGGATSTSTPASTSTTGDKKQDQVQSHMSNDAAQMAKDWTQKMDEVCDLSPDQEKKIMEINLNYANKLEDLKAKYKGMDNPNAEAAKSEKDELTKQRLKDYSNVLSKEQMQKFKQYRDSMKGNDSGSKSDKKSEMKDKYKNATPEEQQQMKEDMKNKKDKKTSDS